MSEAHTARQKVGWRITYQFASVIAAITFLAGFASAEPSPIELTKPYQTLQNAEYYETSKPLGLETVRRREFLPFDSGEVNQGISSGYHWLHFFVHNPSEQTARWILRGETSYLDNLVMYAREGPDSDFKEIRLSDRQSFHTRPLDYRTLSISQQTLPGAVTEVYLLAYHSKPDSVALGFTIHSAGHFAQLVQEENLLLGAFYGALLLMSVLAVLVGILMRDLNAFKYALFLVSTMLLWLMLNGFGFQYLWPDSVYWHNEGFHLVFLLFVFCALEFSKGFLRLSELAPLWHLAFVVVQVIAATAAAMRLAGLYEPVLHIAFLLISGTGLLVILASGSVYRRGLDYALWSLVAWILYTVGLLGGAISAYTQGLQWGMDALFLTQTTSFLETLFLLVAMAKRLTAIESDRKLAYALAHEDALTGLGNRRRLEEAFLSYMRRFSKDRKPVYLIMIDVDRFKRINDRFGHDAGDAVLRAIGSLLRRICRKPDVAVRYGGEEFAVMVSVDDRDAAWRIAERIRREFSDHPTPYGEHMVSHTLCCGVAEVLSAQTQLSAKGMMQRADAALYQAKEAGRNQSYMYEPDIETRDEQTTRIASEVSTTFS